MCVDDVSEAAHSSETSANILGYSVLTCRKVVFFNIEVLYRRYSLLISVKVPDLELSFLSTALCQFLLMLGLPPFRLSPVGN